MKNKQEILSELDAAIDRADMRAIDSGLSELASAQTETITAEDPALFAANILKLSEEKHIMKLRSKPVRILLAVAIVAILGGTAYAASTLNLFSFQSGDRFVTVRTNDDMTEREARDMVAEGENARDTAGAEAITPETEESSYATLAEAEAGLDMKIVMPAAAPDMTIDDINGSRVKYGEGAESRTVWYTASDEEGRMFGITAVRRVAPAGVPVTGYTTSDIDEGSLSSYTSKSGVRYATLSESSPDGSMTAEIATVMIGEYDYSLVFVGFDEAERNAIIDSADLSAYGA